MSAILRALVRVIAAVWASALPAMAQDAAKPITYLDQGWSEEVRGLFYYTPQGSQLMPFEWFLALERPDGQGQFADPAYLSRFGFLPPNGPHPLNPGNLPIGFAVDPSPTTPSTAGPALQANAMPIAQPGRSVGLTCAACHTADITIEGRTIRIDGAPGKLDFDSFLVALRTAVARTYLDANAFQRFAVRIVGDASSAPAAQLRLQFAEFEAQMAGNAAIRHSAIASGFGRVDALTQIMNSLSVVAQAEPNNLREVAAPTSYPQLWLTPQLEFVQWNPIAASPIGRNGGEVLGVFGTSTLHGDQRGWYSSSVLVRQLNDLENWVAQLRPPRWDETIFGPINRTVASTGEGLFRQHCSGCHNMEPYRRTDPTKNLFSKTFIQIGRVDYRDVGTDPTYVESLLTRLVRTNDATAQATGGGAVVPGPNYFLRTVGAIIGRAMQEAGLTDAERAAYNGYRLRPPQLPGGEPLPYLPPSPRDLKAGPLPGIWATGPFLHNGSVATVYELLSPVEERRKVFWVGGQELDRKRLGFVSDDAPGRFRFDTTLPGNGNGGHLYPPQELSPEERSAIIEYLKTL